MAHKYRSASLAAIALAVLLGGTREVHATLLRIPDVLELREQEAELRSAPVVRVLKNCLKPDAQGRLMAVPCTERVQTYRSKRPKPETKRSPATQEKRPLKKRPNQKRSFR